MGSKLQDLVRKENYAIFVLKSMKGALKHLRDIVPWYTYGGLENTINSGITLIKQKQEDRKKGVER